MNASPKRSVRQLLEDRAFFYATIRNYFDAQGVLEAETPLVRPYAVTEPHQHCLDVVDPTASSTAQCCYLQPSPESAMKQLLAMGSGSIYQLGKAFRAGEQGRNHATEFSLLEWYRVGFDHRRLMDDVAALVNCCLPARPVERISYREAFLRFANVDVATAAVSDLVSQVPESAREMVAGIKSEPVRRRAALEQILVASVEPQLGRGCLTFVYDYPADQAALARIRDDFWPVAERFELYIDGVEMANGFHELADESEQRQRFEKDNREREALGLPVIPLDEPLLESLSGLPDCAGVALGVDRLLALKMGIGCLQELDPLSGFSREGAV